MAGTEGDLEQTVEGFWPSLLKKTELALGREQKWKTES